MRQSETSKGTVVDLAVWLRSLGLEQYEAAFRENGVEEAVLPKPTAEDVRDLGVTAVGHRRKLLETIAELRSAQGWKPLPQMKDFTSASSTCDLGSGIWFIHLRGSQKF